MIPLRTFCITLPESPQRKARAAEHFKSVDIQTEWFDGIHAEKFGIQTHHTYEHDNPGTNFRIGFKPTGIWLSHFMLWSALRLLWDDYFLILEDDAKFEKNWHQRLVDALQSVPKDFDMLYVGSCCCKDRPMKLIKNQVWEVKYPMCTHAYIVAKKALPTILRTQRKIYAPIDIGLAFDTLPLLKVYTVLPRIVDQFDTKLDF
jgi:GR25 family glycosyltransferase involved in LPS biosynthesis